MRSKATFFPLWQILKDEYFCSRVIHDALMWGLYGLPSIHELPDLWENLLSGKNIFQSIPFIRPISGKRLIVLEDGILMAINTQDLAKSNRTDLSLGNTIFADIGRYINNNIFHANRDIKIEFMFQIPSKGDFDDIANIFPEQSSIFAYTPNGAIKLLKKENCFNQSIFDKEFSKLSDVILDYNSNVVFDYIFMFSKNKVKELKYSDNDLKCKNEVIQIQTLLSNDNLRAQLPILSDSYAKDNTLGLWDAYWPQGVEADSRWYVPAQLDQECEAANPWNSLRQDSSVCIDFGTSSTVAAVRESDGSIRLLRIGGDLNSLDTRTEYENPTALEFSNYEDLLLPWKNEPWRPFIEWKNIKCSHQAKNELSKGTLSQCGIRNIKTWARARPHQPPLRLKDEQGQSFELTPLSVEELLEGIGDFHERPTDPIELYAYFLGLSLNNQSAFGGRIYCDYAMTFPVKFPQEVRQRILQGFYRGLLRSMPLSLASSPQWKENCPFSLSEQASEPTAFAASVLPYLGIEPTEEGVPFGVFDFGGGTTDFAFGLYRKATPEENGNEGWERVLDILDVSGDENLGGEHLLDILAYEVIRAKCNNADVSKRLPVGVTVVCPEGMRPFPDSELIFAESQEAHANTVNLREKLRPIWEEGVLSDEGSGQISVTMNIGDGKEENVTFDVDEDTLRQCLKLRIREGVLSFFTTFRQAFKANEIRPQELHVLLAGNSCRSPLVREVFEDVIKTEIAPNESETVPIHYEMIPTVDMEEKGISEEKNDVEKKDVRGSIFPTLKTGVALGLLHLLPGEATGIVERNRTNESPFLFSVGMFKNDFLEPVLHRNIPYGEWIPFGKVYRSGWMLLGYSDSPLAMEKQIARTQCHESKVNWGSDNFGRAIFIKAVSPNEAALALSTTEGEGKPDENTIHILRLKN